MPNWFVVSLRTPSKKVFCSQRAFKKRCSNHVAHRITVYASLRGTFVRILSSTEPRSVLR